MDTRWFDSWTRAVAAEAVFRRTALKLLAGGALAGLIAWLGIGEAAAAHAVCSRRHAGARCRRDGQCCSDRCRNGRCRAHHKATCKASQQDFCTQGVAGNVCGTASFGGDCLCVVTTGEAPFCAENFTGCLSCTRDKDCEPFGEGYACVTGGSACPCTDPTKAACAVPCADPD